MPELLSEFFFFKTLIQLFRNKELERWKIDIPFLLNVESMFIYLHLELI